MEENQKELYHLENELRQQERNLALVQTENHQLKKKEKIWKIACLLLSVLVFFSFVRYLNSGSTWGDVALSQGLDAQSKEERNLAKQSLVEAMDYLKKNYYEELTYQEISDKMLKGAMEGMGNKFTRYLNAEEYRSFQESISGEYYGIGVQVANPETTEQVIKRVFEGSPADKAGLLVGDIFRSVDGKKVADLEKPSDLFNLVRGEKDTEVEIGIYRPSTKEELVFKIVRGPIHTPVISSKILGDVAYIRVYEFTATLPEQFEKALLEVKEKNLKKIVFDMRFNPGGDAHALTQILDMLLDEGLISTIVGRSEGERYEEEWLSEDGKIFGEDMKYAILINGDTASASEFFSGALRDRLGVPLIGTQSFGKGVATVSLELSNAGAVNVTTFEYVLPQGEKLNGVGLQPTHLVELKEEYQNVDPENIPEGEDKQLAEALAYLAKAN